MEDLFWTALAVKDQQADYHIIFEDETYWFTPKDTSLPKFRFKREHDEWHAADPQSEAIKDDAVEALERYLMRQH